jgi:hypothetical protein
LEAGDENSKFFHAYAKGRKAANSSWSLDNSLGEPQTTFEGMARVGMEHFQGRFGANNQANIAEVIRVAQLFPRFVEEEDNIALMEEISEEELKENLQSFQKDKSPSLDGWSIEFFLELYDLLGKDLLQVVEDTRLSGRIPACFNSTFIALIPKLDNPSSLNDFRPISLCNCVYKVVSKVIARSMKGILSHHISGEQFGFLEGRQVYEAIGVAQEGLHSIKTKKLKGVILKIDLSKAYDKVSWLYIRMLLAHPGFDIGFIRWIMSCITMVFFSILINGVASPFFHSERGLRQGFPLSPLLFILVAEGLSRALRDVERQGILRGIQVAPNLFITHLLFVDDVLIFCIGSVKDAETLRGILELFSKATRMEINVGKSTLSINLLRAEELQAFNKFFPYNLLEVDRGLK